LAPEEFKDQIEGHGNDLSRILGEPEPDMHGGKDDDLLTLRDKKNHDAMMDILLHQEDQDQPEEHVKDKDEYNICDGFNIPI